MAREVLVAEDSPTQAEALRQVLADGGFAVQVAADGAEALERFSEGRFDAVVSDVVMPRVDGFELCRRIKEETSDPPPVMLLTSLQDPLDVIRALEAGADSFVRKPFESKTLVARLEALLSNRNLRAEARFQTGVELVFREQRFLITAERQQLLDLLVSSFDELVTSNEELRDREQELARFHRELSEQLRLTEYEHERLRTVLDSVALPLVITDRRLLVTEANPATETLLGAAAADIVGRPLRHVVPFEGPDGTPTEVEAELERAVETAAPTELGSSFDLRLVLPGGDREPIQLKAAPVVDRHGGVSALVVLLHELGDLALHSATTGLAGPVLFANRVRESMRTAHERGERTAVVVLRFDRLGSIQSRLSAEPSRHLLEQFGARLRDLVSQPEIAKASTSVSLGYFGSSDFALVLTGLGSELEARRIAELATEFTEAPVSAGGHEVIVPGSAGVALDSPGGNAVSLINAATEAAERATRRGTRVEISTGALDEAAEGRLKLEADLRRAIDEQSLSVHYQPVVNCVSGRIVGFEALARWFDRERGTVPPSQFIPVAEESGLVRPLGEWVLGEACRQLAEWDASIPGEPRMSVNVAVAQLTDDAFVSQVRQSLAETGLDPARLVLEITESAIVGDDDLVAETLRHLRQVGVGIAIDDFGTGHSSLRYLRRFPVETLKIDRSFVAEMARESEHAAIVAGIVRLAHALGINVVAEGVENDDQLVRLRAIGCDFGQGFYWSPGLPAEDVPALTQQWQGPASSPPDARLPDFEDEGAREEEADDALAYLAHELRGPATALAGFAELLADELTDAGEEARHLLTALQRTAGSLADVIVSMEDARSVHRGTLAVAPESIDVPSLVAEVVEDAKPLLGDHPVRYDPPAGVVTCQVDRARLGQALRNLLVNAAKYSPGALPIEVTVEMSEEKTVAIDVLDHGPGIPEDRRHELFRKFSRVNPGRGGMGIGLFLARSIARAHGGDLTYAPAEEGGSCFSLRLPAGSTGTGSQGSNR